MISGIVRKSKRVVSFNKCPRCGCRHQEFYMDKSRDPVWYDVIKCGQCGLEVTGYGATAEEWKTMDHQRWWNLRRAYWDACGVRAHEYDTLGRSIKMSMMKELFTLKEEGKSYFEIAQILDLEESAVRDFFNRVNSKKMIPVCDENGDARLYDGNGKEIDYED